MHPRLASRFLFFNTWDSMDLELPAGILHLRHLRSFTSSRWNPVIGNLMTVHAMCDQRTAGRFGWQKWRPRSCLLTKTTKDVSFFLLSNFVVLFSPEFFRCYGVLKFVNLRRQLPSRKLRYPTWRKGKSSSNMPYQGDMLIPRRVFSNYFR